MTVNHDKNAFNDKTFGAGSGTIRAAVGGRFDSPRQVQRFLFIHDQVANVFSRRPSQETAIKFRSARNDAFTTSAEVTGVAMAA